MDALHCLRNSSEKVLQFFKNDESTDSISEATHVDIDGNRFSMNEPTRFIRADEPVDLRTVIQAWILRSSSITDYLTACQDAAIQNLTFLERSELLTWLEGASDASEFIKPLESEKTADSGADLAGGRIDEILKGERVLGNRQTVLHGIKPTNFSQVRKEAYVHFIVNLRKRNVPEAAPVASSKKRKNNDPIIILSPSASSLINLSNVKPFLEDGIFMPPEPGSGANLISLSRTSSKLGNTRFIVVDGVEKFKPDYWDRVVAVFTTGQAWQFKEYKWSNPKDLFQRVKGFVVTYAGDPMPSTTKDWNVDHVLVERTKRHADLEVVEGMIWDKLERFMETKGWGRK